MNACNDVVNCGSLDVKCCDFNIEVVGTSMSRSWNFNVLDGCTVYVHDTGGLRHLAVMSIRVECRISTHYSLQYRVWQGTFATDNPE